MNGSRAGLDSAPRRLRRNPHRPEPAGTKPASFAASRAFCCVNATPRLLRALLRSPSSITPFQAPARKIGGEWGAPEAVSAQRNGIASPHHRGDQDVLAKAMQTVAARASRRRRRYKAKVRHQVRVLDALS